MRDSSLRRSVALTCSAISRALGGRFPSSAVQIARTCDTVIGRFFFPQPQPLQLQKPQRQQCECHVVPPPHPRAHLVVVQAHLLVALLQHLLDAVMLPTRRYHLGQTHLLGGVTQRVPRLGLLLTTLDHHQPLPWPDAAVLVLRLHPLL